MESWPRRHRITVDEYHRMAEVGLLAPGARVELIDGEIIDMAPIGKDHSSVVSQLQFLLHRAVGERAHVRTKEPVLLDDYSMPEPDLALLKWRDDFYRHDYPTAADTLLVIEVSDTTLRHDREHKAPLYARHGIPEYWIVDLLHHTLHVCRRPLDGRYAEQLSMQVPGVLAPAAVPEAGIDFAGVFSA
jgi:Uma2 family endonuclease